MANLNRVLLIGRLTRPPEPRTTPSGLAIAEFRLAVNNYRRGSNGTYVEETAYVDVTAFGKLAEGVGNSLSKGRQVFVEGHLKYEEWTSKDGQKRSKLSVIADTIVGADSLNVMGGEGGGNRPPRGSYGGAGNYGAPPSYGSGYGDQGGADAGPDDWNSAPPPPSSRPPYGNPPERRSYQGSSPDEDYGAPPANTDDEIPF